MVNAKVFYARHKNEFQLDYEYKYKKERESREGRREKGTPLILREAEAGGRAWLTCVKTF